MKINNDMFEILTNEELLEYLNLTKCTYDEDTDEDTDSYEYSYSDTSFDSFIMDFKKYIFKYV